MIGRMVVLICFFLILFLPASSFSAGSPMEVVVSIGPQKWLVDQVGGELVTGHVLIDKGQGPHTFIVTPAQLRTLGNAQLYCTIGLEFEKALLKKIKQNMPHLTVVDISSTIEKRSMRRKHGHTEDHSAHQNEHVHEHGHHEQAHGDGLDPHVWLSPKNLGVMAVHMAELFVESDPENKKQYDEQLKNTLETLEKLDAEIKQKLAPYHGKSFYVFHPAFGYFGDTYHLHQEAIEVQGKSPTPKQLSRLIEKARAEQAKVLFVQPQFDPNSANAVAAAIDGEVLPLDPLAENVLDNLRVMASKLALAFERRGH